MNTITARANTFSTTIVTTLLVLVAATACTSFLPFEKPDADLTVRSIHRFQVVPKEKTERAILELGVRADLTDVWRWNVKYLYVSVVADFQSPSKPRNEVVVWDTIIRDKSQANITRNAQVNKYALKDPSFGLRGTDVRLSLHYMIFPHMGPLLSEKAGQYVFSMPSDYLQ